MSSTGRNKKGSARDPRDFYPTPAWAVEELYKAVPGLPVATLDPCAGSGSLILGCASRRRSHLFNPRKPPQGVEIDPALVEKARGRGATSVEVGDGLKMSWAGKHIIINPPFGDAEAWIEKGVREAVSMCALLRLNYLGSAKRHEFWKKNPPRGIVVLSTRPSFVKSGKTDSTEYAWFIWSNDPRLDRADGLITLDFIKNPATEAAPVSPAVKPKTRKPRAKKAKAPAAPGVEVAPVKDAPKVDLVEPKHEAPDETED